MAPCAQVLISKEPTVAGRVAVHVAGLEDELGLLKQLDHPNIVRYLVRASTASGLCCAGLHQSQRVQDFLHGGITQSQAVMTPTDMLLSYAGHRED